jgi:hypothetical protein
MNPQQFLTLLDMAKRRGSDAAVGLIEEVVTYAPEVEKIFGRPINGTSYNARIRPLLTKGGAFRKANAGIVSGASVFDERRFNTFFFDSQLQVDEAIARAAESQGDSLALLQAEEAEGAIRAKAILLGQQIYAGHQIDPLGFPGLIDFYDTYSASVIDQRTGSLLNLEVDAGGTSGVCEIVWYIRMHPQGVHFLFGANQGIDIKPWTFQRVADQNDPSKNLMAWISNLSGFIGLSSAHPYAIGLIKNVDNTISGGNYTKPVTDALMAQLEAKFPVGFMPNLVLMSRASRAGLQQARTVTLFGQATNPTASNSGAAANIAPVPTTTASGIPIQVTDSILTGAHF